MCEEQHDNAYGKQSTQLILGLGSYKKPAQKQGCKGANQENSSDETVLFPEDREDKIGVHDGAGEIAKFIQRVVGLESLAPKPSTADRIQGLVDGPSCPSWIK